MSGFDLVSFSVHICGPVGPAPKPKARPVEPLPPSSRYYLEDHPQYERGREWERLVLRKVGPIGVRIRERALRLAGVARAALEGEYLRAWDVLAEALRDPRDRRCEVVQVCPDRLPSRMTTDPRGVVLFETLGGYADGARYYGALRLVEPDGEPDFLTVVYSADPNAGPAGWSDAIPGQEEAFE